MKESGQYFSRLELCMHKIPLWRMKLGSSWFYAIRFKASSVLREYLEWTLIHQQESIKLLHFISLIENPWCFFVQSQQLPSLWSFQMCSLKTCRLCSLASYAEYRKVIFLNGKCLSIPSLSMNYLLERWLLRVTAKAAPGVILLSIPMSSFKEYKGW